jgi:hypothetical protein
VEKKTHEKSGLGGAMVWRRVRPREGRGVVVLVFGMEEGMRIFHGKGLMRCDTSAVWDQSRGKVVKEDLRGASRHCWGFRRDALTETFVDDVGE